MKGKLMIVAGLTACGLTATAQTQYEAARFSSSELNGTARFVGMGGAMGALGADYIRHRNQPCRLSGFSADMIFRRFWIQFNENKQ